MFVKRLHNICIMGQHSLEIEYLWNFWWIRIKSMKLRWCVAWVFFHIQWNSKVLNSQERKSCFIYIPPVPVISAGKYLNFQPSHRTQPSELNISGSHPINTFTENKFSIKWEAVEPIFNVCFEIAFKTLIC